MKKLFIAILGIAAAVMLALSVSANTYTVSPYRNEIKNYDGVFTKMYEAMSSVADSVDLSPYKISAEDVIQIYSDVIMASPELFYADNSITYFYDPWRGYVTKVEFNYSMSDDEIIEASLIYEREIDYISSLVDVAMSEAEKALYVHDYLIASYSYDTSESNYDVLSLFTDRSGVCQAYSLTYMAVLRELGMDVVMVTSDEMNHAWNLVEIDGEWYHVDLSFDDPSPDRLGRVMHENFLLDDAGIKTTSTPHYGWVSSVRCGSSAFKNRIWNGVSSRMIYIDSQWYYIDSTSLSLTVSKFDGTGRFEVYRFRDKWTTEHSEDSYYVGVFSGLSECFGYLFVNTPYDIVIYNPHTGKSNVYIEGNGEDKIFGSSIYRYTLEYYTDVSPNSSGTGSSRVETFEITEFSDEDFGDSLPFDDVLRLDQYYAAVKFVYNKGLFRGVSATKFAPDAYLTRAMFVTVLGRLCEVDVSQYTSVNYIDVEDGQWYSPYVEWAADSGIVNGIGGNLFDPMGELTHEQMYKIVAMCGEYLGVGSAETETALILYEDRVKISDWALDSIAYCKVNSLIGEKFSQKIYPTSKSTRAEAADIISRFAILCSKA